VVCWYIGVPLIQRLADVDYALAELETTSEGGEYGAIPLITDSQGITLFSVDQCRAAHVEKDSKLKVRRGASAMRQEPENREKLFRGYRILEPEEVPQGGRELYWMDEDEGLPEIVLDFGDDESMLVEERGGEELAYKYSGDEAVYVHSGEQPGCNDYDMDQYFSFPH
jgi:hypothetical protein